MIQQTPTDTTDELQELDELELAEIKQKSVAGAASYFGRSIFLHLFSLAASLVLSAYLSKEDFAIYGFVIQFIGLLNFFSDVGLAASLVQKKNKPSLSDYRTAFTTQQILSWLIFLACGLIAASGIIQREVGNAGVWILLILGLSFPLASFKTISAIKLERKLDFSKLVIPQVLEQVIFNILLIVLAFNGLGVMSYFWAILARSLLGTVVMFALKPWPIGFEFNIQSFKSLFSFGAKFQLNDLIARIKDNLFSIVLIKLMSTGDYGYMIWAKTYSMYPYNLTVNNVMAVTFPTFSRLQHNKKALAKAIEKSLFFITLLIFPMVTGMAVFVYPLTQVISKFNKWEPAVISFVLFTLGIAFSAISSPLVNTLNAIGKINQSLKLMIMWTVLTWTITPLALKIWGYHGVSIAAFIIAFTSILPVVLVKKIVKFNFVDQIWRQLIATLAMAIFSLVFYKFWQINIAYLILGMGLSSLVYLASLGLVGYKKLFLEIKSVVKK